MAGFNRLALESNSIYGLLKDVHKIGRCHTNKKNVVIVRQNGTNKFRKQKPTKK